jgi:hypothetical protein
MKHLLSIWLLLMLLLAWWAIPAGAFTLGDVRVHGFGGWAYAKTDNVNQYLDGNEDGSYEHVNFSLNISAFPAERLSLHIQTGYASQNSGEEAGLDYAFAEWFFADALILRAGKVKAPFMLYTETLDVGTIRPFFHLSQGVYQQFAAEAYNGVGFTGALYPTDEWEIRYDLYGGKLSLLPNRFAVIQGQSARFQEYEPEFEQILGGRLSLYPPLEGTALGISTYGGKLGDDPSSDLISLRDTYLFLGASLGYLGEKLWFRAEYLTEQGSEKLDLDVAYAEIAWQLTEHWQIATRYEWGDFLIPALVSIFPDSFFEHRELVIGLNYWLNPNFVWKLSFHQVQGNRFANPATVQDFVTSLQRGRFEEDTQLILIGTQFSF